MKQTISATRIFTGESYLSDYAILIEHDRIVELKPLSQIDTHAESFHFFDGLLCAGFIDLQVNGGGGLLFNDQPQVQTLYTMAEAHRSFGTTSILPTLMSDSPEIMAKAIHAANAVHALKPSQLLGIHIEGPFFNVAKKGIHNEKYLRQLTTDDIEILAKAEGTRLLTLAPEKTAVDLIKQLSELGYQVWAGHSNADADSVNQAIAAGLSGFTHLYNAMSMLSAREPAMLGSALVTDHCWASVIADGHHLHPTSLQIAMRCKPAGKLLLVSDAMSTVGTDGADFQLDGQTIYAVDGVLKNAQGTLAGSAISLLDAVNYVQDALAVEEAEAIRMATMYPAQAMGLTDQLGELKPGYKANIIHISDKKVCHTWIDGQMKKHIEG
ncbi:N-acetylglucosamine-6-phosphate deacetylase [Marinomonas sp. THO17]|uniref:N-acetylglucosamine-6-phosphate deacetylase n=1 Tax=Marinomonas sp. THO17 TaxID=3149048 RepID=UPI00336BB2ED